MTFSLRARLGAAVMCVSAVIGMTAVIHPAAAFDQLAQGFNQGGPAVARMSLRITQLENEIRRLTGQNEELSHRLRQLQEKLEKAAGDTELRLKALEGGGKPMLAQEGAGTSNASPTATAKPAMTMTAVAPAQSVHGATKGARVLGTLRGGQGAAASQTARAMPKPPSLAKETPKQKYDRAHSLIIKQRKYGEAEKVLRTFIDANPKHKLTPNAHYWLGRTFFVRGDFENAAFAFADGFQKFPKSKKAPANLLNLGMSLSRLGKNREACTTYTRLLRTYRQAEDSVKRRVTRERNRAKCRQR